MPSQKQNSSSDNNLLHHHDSSQQQPSRCKRSRSQRGGAENDDDNEDERDYEQDEEEEQQQQQEVKEEEQDSEDEDSDGSRSSDDPAKLPEWFLVELPAALRTYVQCPICLGIIKKTRTVTECLHRFCRECIDKWMRMGSKQCPACRTHCASQRSLRDDPRFDALIHFLYDDIEKYEEEELAFHEEEKTHNKQASTSMKHGHLSGGHIPVSDTVERLGHVGTRAM